MIKLNWTKVYTLKEYLDLRNKLLIRANARTKHFRDNKENYYWYQLNNLDTQYPEFRSLGVIKLKTPIRD